jgi:voltage-gated potassium channel Kch
VLTIAVFGPGRVTIHRILGAIAIYLNVAAAFALAYRLIASLEPGAFATRDTAGSDHALSTFVYFSFSTLTTSGFGDIVARDPFARSLASLEGVIGQLFPATLLARLITLELETRRRLRNRAASRDDPARDGAPVVSIDRSS